MWQERCCCALTKLPEPRGGALFTESSLLFLTWGSEWLQAKELVGPEDRGVDGTCGGQCGPWLLMGPPEAVVGPPVANSVARGCWWHLWWPVGAAVVGVAQGCGQPLPSTGLACSCPERAPEICQLCFLKCPS